MSRKWNDFAIASSRRTLQLAFQTLLVVAAMRPCAAGAQPLYWGGGSTDIAANTPLPINSALLTGTWNTTTQNWATSSMPGAYTTFTDGGNVQLGYYTNNANATITLAANAQIAGLTACMNRLPASTYNQIFDITATSAKTLTLAAPMSVFSVVSQDSTRGMRVAANVSLAGSATLVKNGFGSLTISSDCSNFTGLIDHTFGLLSLSDTSIMKNVPRFDVKGRVVSASATSYGGNEFSLPSLRVVASSGANDKLGDAARIVLGRGSFDYRSAATSTETIGQVDLETWGILGSASGTAGGVLTIADSTSGITRGNDNLGMALVPVGSTGGNVLNIRVLNGLPSGTLIPWLSSNRSGFMYMDSADNNTLKQVAVSEAATDVTSWVGSYGASSNLRVGNDTNVSLSGTLTDNLTISSLGFFTKDATQLTLASGKTLTLDSGALAFKAGGASAHVTMANGFLTSGTDQLYLHAGDSNHSGSLYIQSVVTGADMDVLKAGLAGIFFSGSSANTYTGKTVVLGGTLSLSKPDHVVSIPGDLVVHNGGAVACANMGQFGATSAITINKGGILSFTDNQTLGGTLTIAGGTIFFPNLIITLNQSGTGLVFNGGWINQSSTGGGTLDLQTDVKYESSASTQARFERLNTGTYSIELDGGNRTFDIANSATLPEGVPEMVIDTAIVPGSPAGGALVKTGTGTLQLVGANTYAGGTTVNGGTVHVAMISAPAQNGLTAFTSSSGQDSSVVIFNAPVAKSMALGQVITGSTIHASGRTVLRVISDYKILTSAQNITGVSTNVAVAAMSRSGNLGTGPATVNDTGTLEIDAGITLANTVTVNAGGTIAASGASLGSLVVDGGTVSVNLANGALAVSGTVNLANATLNFTGTLDEEPVTLLTAGTSLTGTFATVNNQPPYSTLRYIDDTVVLAPDLPTVIIVK